MTSFRSVLAFGDSHVAGCELSNKIYEYLDGSITIEEADEFGKQTAFPQLVASELNIPCYNYAMSGGSNTRSLRVLATAIQEHPDSLVLFGYTCPTRTEFHYPDHGSFLGRDNDNFIQVGMQWDNVSSHSKLEHPLNDVFVEHILRYYNNLDQTLFYVDAVCKLHASQVLHMSMTKEKFRSQSDMFDFQGHTCYINWCEERKFKQLPYMHYGQDAHNELAKLIMEAL